MDQSTPFFSHTMEVHQSTIDNSFPITGRPSNGHPLRSKEHDVIPVRDDVLWLHSAAQLVSLSREAFDLSVKTSGGSRPILKSPLLTLPAGVPSIYTIPYLLFVNIPYLLGLGPISADLGLSQNAGCLNL